MSQTLYVIPDIHGQLEMLETALARVEKDGGTKAKIVYLGDYVDRGPNSAGVIQRLINGQSQGQDWITLRGNHDQMFLEFLETGRIHNPRFSNPDYTWLHDRLGGKDTLVSYGITTPEQRQNRSEILSAVPKAHRDWLAGLPLSHTTSELLILHAGIKPGVPLHQQTPDDMIWIRDAFLTDPRRHPWLVVHGHTALEYPRHFGNRIDLDGGAGWGRPLWPAVFEGRDCWLLSDGGRVPLRP